MKLTINLRSIHECEDAVSVIKSLHPELSQTVATTSTPETAIPEPVQESAPVVETPVQESLPLDPQAGVELDANGTPHLAEVHATTKTKTAKGVWKAKRGVAKDVLAAAEAAARAKISGTPQPVTPTAEVVPPEAEPAPVVTMNDVSQAWTTALQAGLVTAEGAGQLYATIGVDPAQLNTNETMRASMVNHLNGLMAQPAPTGMPPGA